MKTRIDVEFEVEIGTNNAEGEEAFDEGIANQAAAMAAYDNLVITRNGVGVHEDCVVHVDGFGDCTVKLSK